MLTNEGLKSLEIEVLANPRDIDRLSILADAYDELGSPCVESCRARVILENLYAEMHGRFSRFSSEVWLYADEDFYEFSGRLGEYNLALASTVAYCAEVGLRPLMGRILFEWQCEEYAHEFHGWENARIPDQVDRPEEYSLGVSLYEALEERACWTWLDAIRVLHNALVDQNRVPEGFNRKVPDYAIKLAKD